MMPKQVKADWLKLDQSKFQCVYNDSESDDYERGIMSFTSVFEHIPTGTFWQVETKTATSDDFYSYDSAKVFISVATCEHRATPDANFEKFINEGRIKEVFRKSKTVIYYE